MSGPGGVVGGLGAASGAKGTDPATHRPRLLFVQMGGTIDKDYPAIHSGWAFEIAGPAVKRVLEKVFTGFAAEFVTVCAKDSMEVTDEDRDNLANACSEATASRIIVTHGTDTLVQTAQYISRLARGGAAGGAERGSAGGGVEGKETILSASAAARLAAGLADKVIVFTGAMRPQKFVDSDASFNVGAAVGTCNVAAPGVYVTMGGRVFECNQASRNMETGEFIEKVE